jgi:hypothetical protein
MEMARIRFKVLSLLPSFRTQCVYGTPNFHLPGFPDRWSSGGKAAVVSIKTRRWRTFSPGAIRAAMRLLPFSMSGYLQTG